MKEKVLFLTSALFALVLFAYTSTNAQVVDKAVEKTKDAASKVKDVTQEAASKTKDAAVKTTVVVSDALDDSASKTKQGTEKAAKVGASKAQQFGGNVVSVTENVAGETYEGGKYLTVTAWDGAKWVSKQVWYPNKKKP